MHRIAAPLMTAALWPSLLTTPSLAQAYGDRDIWWAWGFGHMLFGGLMMIVFWGGIIALIVLLVRWLGGASGDSSGPGSRRTPLQILQERFATGEIDHLDHEARQMPLRKPFIHRGRKQKPGLTVNLAEIAHQRRSIQENHSMIPNRIPALASSPTGS